MTPEEHTARAEALLELAEERLANPHNDGADATQYATVSAAHALVAQNGYGSMAAAELRLMQGGQP